MSSLRPQSPRVRLDQSDQSASALAGPMGRFAGSGSAATNGKDACTGERGTVRQRQVVDGAPRVIVPRTALFNSRTFY